MPDLGSTKKTTHKTTHKTTDQPVQEEMGTITGVYDKESRPVTSKSNNQNISGDEYAIPGAIQETKKVSFKDESAATPYTYEEESYLNTTPPRMDDIYMLTEDQEIIKVTSEKKPPKIPTKTKATTQAIKPETTPETKLTTKPPKIPTKTKATTQAIKPETTPATKLTTKPPKIPTKAKATTQAIKPITNDYESKQEPYVNTAHNTDLFHLLQYTFSDHNAAQYHNAHIDRILDKNINDIKRKDVKDKDRKAYIKAFNDRIKSRKVEIESGVKRPDIKPNIKPNINPDIKPKTHPAESAIEKEYHALTKEEKNKLFAEIEMRNRERKEEALRNKKNEKPVWRL